MKDGEKIAAGVCIVLTLALVGVFVWLAVGHNKDNFCGACQNIGLQVNTNRKLLSKLYNSGQLTENSKLERGTQWKTGPYDGSQFHQYPPRPTGRRALWYTSIRV